MMVVGVNKIDGHRVQNLTIQMISTGFLEQRENKDFPSIPEMNRK